MYVVHTYLGKGDAKALSRCIPQACGATVYHFRTIETCGRFITIWGSVPAATQNPHDNFIKTKGRILSPIWTPIANSIEANLPQIGYAPRGMFIAPVEPLTIVPARLRAKGRLFPLCNPILFFIKNTDINIP